MEDKVLERFKLPDTDELQYTGETPVYARLKLNGSALTVSICEEPDVDILLEDGDTEIDMLNKYNNKRLTKAGYDI